MTTLDSTPKTDEPRTTVAPPRTTLPDRARPDDEQSRRKLGGIRGTDVLALVGALAAALTTTGLLWTQLSPFTGWLGYVGTSRVLFVLTHATPVAVDENRPQLADP